MSQPVVKHSAMASFPFIISLLLLVGAPQLCAIEISEPGAISIFGRPTLDMTIDIQNEIYWGQVLHSFEEAMNLQWKDIDPPPTAVRRHILEKQPAEEDEPPPRLIQVTFVSSRGKSAKVVFRPDNLYISGFANRFNEYFVLRGQEHVMPGATVLLESHEYSSLLGRGGLKTYLPDLPLGKDPLDDVTDIMSDYPSGARSGEIGRALATVSVMGPESLRIIPVREKVIEIWESGAAGYLIDDDGVCVKYMMNWSNMSRMLWCSRYHLPLLGGWGKQLRKDKIKSRQEILEAVNIMIWPQGFDEDNLAKSCGH